MKCSWYTPLYAHFENFLKTTGRLENVIDICNPSKV